MYKAGKNCLHGSILAAASSYKEHVQSESYVVVWIILGSITYKQLSNGIALYIS